MDEARAVRSFEDLVVFQRAYRLSLEGPSSEPGLSTDRAESSWRSGSAGEQIDLREHRRRVRQAAAIGGRVQALPDGGGGLGGRDARMGALLLRSGIHRRGDVASVARRVSGDRPDAAGPLLTIGSERPSSF